MNKMELISAIAEKAELSKKDAEKALTAVVESISEALKTGDKVQLIGFGSFEVKNREARIGRNPKTKEEIRIPASKTPVFKAGKALKDKAHQTPHCGQRGLRRRARHGKRPGGQGVLSGEGGRRDRRLLRQPKPAGEGPAGAGVCHEGTGRPALSGAAGGIKRSAPGGLS